MKKTTPPLIVGNWKMNPQSEKMAKRLMSEVKEAVMRKRGVEVVVAPPTIYLPSAAAVRSGSKKIMLGAQNAHWEPLGAHTGEVSVSMLKDYQVEYVILGHSERRAMGERDEDITKKMHAVLKAGLTAIVCVGEKKRDHNAHYLSFVEEQVRKAFAGISKAKLGQTVVAYEPIWAIGTGNNATPGDAHEMKLFIQKILTDIYTRNYASKVRILYGGSVNGKNARELIDQGTVDGFLVGGASLRSEEFATIISESVS